MTSPVPRPGHRDTWLRRQTPNIRPGFPSGGEILGPLWMRLWHLLGDMETQTGTDFPGMCVTDLADAVQHNRTTVGNLLRQAAKAGLVQTQPGHGQGVHALAKLYRHRRDDLHMHDTFTWSWWNEAVITKAGPATSVGGQEPHTLPKVGGTSDDE